MVAHACHSGFECKIHPQSGNLSHMACNTKPMCRSKDPVCRINSYHHYAWRVHSARGHDPIFGFPNGKWAKFNTWPWTYFWEE